MAKKAYQEGHVRMRMLTKGKRGTLNKLAPLCASPSVCPFLELENKAIFKIVPKLSQIKFLLSSTEKNIHRGTYS